MLLYGIIGLIVVGASWCLIGIVLGRAPKEGIDARIVQLCTGLVSVAASLVIAAFFLPPAPCPHRALFAVCATYFLGGAFDCVGMLAMSAGMQRGPNGIVWSIMQSAPVFPFIVGILFFNVAPTPPRLLGIAAILAALCCFAATKDNSGGAGRGWRFFALLALGVIAVQQNLTTLPSYYDEARQISPVVRALSTSLGSLTVVVMNIAFGLLRDYGGTSSIFAAFLKPRLWLYVLGIQSFSLIFAYTLFYPGIDILAKAGAGAVSYPLMVGSCIVSFTLYAMLVLKERAGRIQIAALALCLLGLACLCFQSPPTNRPSPVRDAIHQILFGR